MTAPLALVELLDRDGRVRRALPVTNWPLRIGRAIDNDLVLDDPHVAPYHARIEAGDDGLPWLVALPSVNGVQVGRRRLGPGERTRLTGADLGWTVGTARLRARLAGEPLAPERALHVETGQGATIGFALALWAWQLAAQAIRLDPGAKLTEWLAPLFGVPASVAGWCLAWALASKLFQQRFDFWAHVAVAVRFLLGIEVAGFVLDGVAAVTSWDALSRISGGVEAAIGVAMIWAHARLVLPNRARALALFATGAYVVGAGIVVTQNLQRNDRVFTELYSATLPPPGLLWAKPVAPEVFVRDAAALRERLDRSVRDAQAEDKDDGQADAGD